MSFSPKNLHYHGHQAFRCLGALALTASIMSVPLVGLDEPMPFRDWRLAITVLPEADATEEVAHVDRDWEQGDKANLRFSLEQIGGTIPTSGSGFVWGSSLDVATLDLQRKAFSTDVFLVGGGLKAGYATGNTLGRQAAWHAEILLDVGAGLSTGTLYRSTSSNAVDEIQAVGYYAHAGLRGGVGVVEKDVQFMVHAGWAANVGTMYTDSTPKAVLDFDASGFEFGISLGLRH